MKGSRLALVLVLTVLSWLATASAAIQDATDPLDRTALLPVPCQNILQQGGFLESTTDGLASDLATDANDDSSIDSSYDGYYGHDDYRAAVGGDQPEEELHAADTGTADSRAPADIPADAGESDTLMPSDIEGNVAESNTAEQPTGENDIDQSSTTERFNDNPTADESNVLRPSIDEDDAGASDTGARPAIENNTDEARATQQLDDSPIADESNILPSSTGEGAVGGLGREPAPVAEELSNSDYDPMLGETQDHELQPASDAESPDDGLDSADFRFRESYPDDQAGAGAHSSVLVKPTDRTGWPVADLCVALHSVWRQAAAFDWGTLLGGHSVRRVLQRLVPVAQGVEP